MQENIAITLPMVVLAFQASNVPDAAGNAKAVEPASNDYVMPWRGSIVGMSVRSNADYSGGVLTFRPTINGTANTGLTAVMDDTNQQAYSRKDARIINFAAGDRLGVDWVKSGTVAPTTTDVVITLFVLLEDVQL